MPVLGSETGATGSFGELPNIPEKYQAAARRGIHFFELRYPKPIDMDQTIFGPLDVLAKEDWDTMRNKMVFHIKWLRENAAHIRFVPNSSGGVAWMPDDKFWRNRIYLMDNPLMYRALFAYHTRNGQFPGTSIRKEVDCLREVLKEKKNIYRVLMNGREVVFFHSEEEAQAYVNENTEVKHRVDSLTGEVKTVMNKHKFSIVPGTIVDYRDEVVELIKRENPRHEFGWTQSADFDREMRPKVEALIEERNRQDAAASPMDEREKILSILKGLTFEERQELLSKTSSVKTATPVSDHTSEVEEESDSDSPPPSEVDPWKKRLKSHYRKMKKTELETIYQGRGLDPEGMTFVKLVDALFEQDEKGTSGDVVGDFSPLPQETTTEVIT